MNVREIIRKITTLNIFELYLNVELERFCTLILSLLLLETNIVERNKSLRILNKSNHEQK